MLRFNQNDFWIRIVKFLITLKILLDAEAGMTGTYMGPN